MDKKIFFSVLIPIYKTEKYLRTCIDSILNQTYKNFNIILVDDESPDKCPEICDEYVKSNERIYVVHKKNEGSMAARISAVNYAMENFKDVLNHFFIFVDSDDTLKYNALEIIEENIRKNMCDMLIFKADITYNGKIISPYLNRCDAGDITKKKEALRMIGGECYNSLWCKAVHKKLFVQKDYTKYYHIKIGEDLIQSLDIMANAKKITIIDDSLYNYEKNPESIMNSIDSSNYKLKSTFRKIVCEFLNSQECWDENDRAWYNNLTQDFIAKEAREIVYTMKKKNVYIIWDKIINDEYYNKFLKKITTKRILNRFTLNCIRKKYYVLLWLACKIKIVNRKFKKRYINDG